MPIGTVWRGTGQYTDLLESDQSEPQKVRSLSSNENSSGQKNDNENASSLSGNIEINGNGSTTIKTSTKTDTQAKIALAVVTVNDMDNAISMAVADENGIKKVNVELPEISGVKNYIAEIPTKALELDNKV